MRNLTLLATLMISGLTAALPAPARASSAETGATLVVGNNTPGVWGLDFSPLLGTAASGGLGYTSVDLVFDFSSPLYLANPKKDSFVTEAGAYSVQSTNNRVGPETYTPCYPYYIGGTGGDPIWSCTSGVPLYTVETVQARDVNKVYSKAAATATVQIGGAVHSDQAPVETASRTYQGRSLESHTFDVVWASRSSAQGHDDTYYANVYWVLERSGGSFQVGLSLDAASLAFFNATGVVPYALSGTGSYTLDDVRLSGTVASVPEPASALLWLLGLGAAGGCRQLMARRPTRAARLGPVAGQPA